MGTKRPLSSVPAATAAPTDRPVVRMDSAANCAEPTWTNADMTIAASGGKPASAAGTPNDAPTTAATTAKGTAAEAPARTVPTVGAGPAAGNAAC
jgi:hypothetical protein